LVNLLALFNLKGPESTDTAFVVGYYIGSFFILFFGAALIITGIQIRRKLKRKLDEKNLLDSLPK